jgi:NTE family protein
MVRALFDHGIEPDLVVGCSVGAINGAAIAAEPGRLGLKRMERIWGRLADGKPELMPRSFLPLAIQMGRKGESLHDPLVLATLLDEELLCDSFEDLELPFACVATDLDNSDEHWFEHGALVPALLASAALPAVYPPVEIAGRRYIDGGVVREAPVAHAVEMGATDVYFMHVGHLAGREFRAQRPFDAAIHSYWTLRHRRLLDDLASVADVCNLVSMPAGVRPRLRFDDFSKGRELIAAAYEASNTFLESGRIVEPVEIWSKPRRDRGGLGADEPIDDTRLG